MSYDLTGHWSNVPILFIKLDLTYIPTFIIFFQILVYRSTRTFNAIHIYMRMGAGRWELLCEHKDYETLMRYLEALPKTYDEILLQQSDQYVRFIMQSPSAAAYAFMKTQNNKFLVNLNSVIQRCGYGGTIDQEFVKISMFNYPKN